MAEIETKTGTCRYCGQSVIVKLDGILAATHMNESDLDNLASDQCMCLEAQSARRKRKRQESIEKFVNKHFDSDVASFIHYAIKKIEKADADLVELTCKLPDDRLVKIWRDNDQYLRIKIKKTEDEELKI